jgi:hypothetical protein
MIKKAAISSLAALTLAGCIVSSGTRYHVADPYQFFNRSARGGIPIVVAGQPYAGRQPAVEAAVTTAFAKVYPTFAKPLITVPSAPAASVSDRLVIVFNLPGRPIAQSICSNTASMGGAGGAGADQKIYASAAFCGGKEPYSSSWIEFPNPGGPDSPAFVQALENLIREAAPRDPDPSELRGKDPMLP